MPVVVWREIKSFENGGTHSSQSTDIFLTVRCVSSHNSTECKLNVRGGVTLR